MLEKVGEDQVDEKILNRQKWFATWYNNNIVILDVVTVRADKVYDLTNIMMDSVLVDLEIFIAKYLYSNRLYNIGCQR